MKTGEYILTNKHGVYLDSYTGSKSGAIKFFKAKWQTAGCRVENVENREIIKKFRK
jgi:hypothetical protein